MSNIYSIYKHLPDEQFYHLQKRRDKLIYWHWHWPVFGAVSVTCTVLLSNYAYFLHYIYLIQEVTLNENADDVL